MVLLARILREPVIVKAKFRGQLYQCPRRPGRSIYTEYLLSIYPGNWDHGAAVVVAVVGGTGSRLQDTDHRWTAALYSATLQPVTNSIFCNQDVQTQPSVTVEWRSPDLITQQTHNQVGDKLLFV